MTKKQQSQPPGTAIAHRPQADVVQREAQDMAVYAPPTADEVRKMLCPKATDRELELFINICLAEKLNPFTGDIFLIKYKDDEPAANVIAAKAYLKAAENSSDYDGHEAGIILKVEGSPLPVFRDGTFMLQGENLVGGWARVFRKDRSKPFYVAVHIAEVRKVKADGSPNRVWRTEPANMARKVALHRALREAFPNRFAMTTTTTEAMDDGEFRPAFVNALGESEWNKWWPRQLGKGLTEAEVHQILEVESVKDWLDAGKTLEDAENAINEALKSRTKKLGAGQKQPARHSEGTSETSPGEPPVKAPVQQKLGEQPKTEPPAEVKPEAAKIDPARQRELRIQLQNILMKAQGMTKEEGRAWVERNCGHESTAEMTVPELEAAIEKARREEDLPF